MTTIEHLSQASFADLYCLQSHLAKNGPTIKDESRRERYSLLKRRVSDEMAARVEILAANIGE